MAEASLEDLMAFLLEKAIELIQTNIGYLMLLADDEDAVDHAYLVKGHFYGVQHP